MADSLFGEEFEIKVKPTKVKDLVKKVKEPKAKEEKELTAEKVLKSKKISLEERLAVINENVLKVLGKQKNNVLVIKDLATFENYITAAINLGRIAIDTETNNSLDPITCKLMGLCLYVPGEKQAYIPINHRDPNTKEKLSWQLTEEDCKNQLQRILEAKTYIIMHNGKFDYKVLKCTCGVEMKPDWDTLIASKLIDENELSAGLKQQYISKIDPSQAKYSIDHLFENVEYADVDPDIFALYAATDSFMTDKLYLYQKPIMEGYKTEPGVFGKSIYDLFIDVEMPCVISTAEMELNGILFDTEYAKRLKVKFETKLAEIDASLAEELNRLEPKIQAWKEKAENKESSRVYVPASTKMSAEKIKEQYPSVDADGRRYKIGKPKASQLENPINMASPSQLAILLYDIIGCKVVDKDAPRGTGEEVLEKLNLPLTNILLERRGVVKLLDAFINSLPENVNSKTGKIHCSFNQYGAKTGRFSSSAPNLQQIPSHEKSIRMLFKADPGYILVGSDFSQQEPRLLSFYSRDNNMINAYKEGKDLYATIAKGVYRMGYWDCMEHHEDGSPNPEGKKRRASCKAILLGIMYGRGAAAIAEQIHSTKEEAQQIVDDFYTSFPQVKTWMDESLAGLKQNTYTEDFYGRRRRLTDISLNAYDVSPKDTASLLDDFNPLLSCSDRPNDKIIEWTHKLAATIEASQAAQRARIEKENIKRSAENKPLKVWEPNDEMANKTYEELAKQALADGIIIQANTARRAQAARQCVNARIQGGAATMTKIAMNKITSDPELKFYDFKLCIGVHDELIGQCKEEYATQCANRLCDIMKNSVADIVDVPFKCDPAITHAWYEDEVAYQIKDEYADMLKSGTIEDDAIIYLQNKYSEFTAAQVIDFIRNEY